MTLKSQRLNRGLTVEQVAQAVDAKAPTVYYWERTGSRPRDAALAKRVADFFGVAVTDLWPVEPPERSAA